MVVAACMALRLCVVIGARPYGRLLKDLDG